MRRILVVDDGPARRGGVRGTLRKARYEVLEAEDAERGLQIVRIERPDLVICDLHLGGRSGWDVLAAMRGEPSIATIPLILITASEAPSALRESMNLGADDFLRKPFTRGELLDAVKARLCQQEMNRAESGRALRDSETRFRAIADAALDAIILMGPDGRISFWNPAAERTFGYPAAEAIGQSLHALLVPGLYKPAHDQAFPLFQSTGHGAALGRTLELTALRKDGTEFPVELSLSALSLHGAWHAVGIVRDITERRRTADRLRALSQAIEQTPVSIVITDPSGRIEYVNPWFEQVTGYTAAEAIGQNPRVLKSGEQSLEFYRELWATIGAGREWKGEFRNKKKTGEDYWEQASISPVRDAVGRTIRFIAVKQDITQRKQEERRLNDSQELYSSLVENLPQSVFRKNREGRFQFCNRRFLEDLGRSLSEIVGKTDADLFPPALAGAYRRDDLRVMESGQTLDQIEENVAADGRKLFVQVVKSPLRDASGHIVGIQGIFWDVTEQKRAEAERRGMEMQLRQAQKLQAIGQLAAGISHEINTPVQFIGDNTRFLGEIFGGLDQLLAKCSELIEAGRRQAVTPELVAECSRLWDTADINYLRAEVPSALSQTLEGVERISKIVCAMKDFSHPGTEEKALVDLNKLVDSTLTVSRNEWKYVAELITDFDPTLTAVPCLPGEFNQVILNLVVNAAHAIGDVLKPGAAAMGTLTVSTRRIETWAEVRVADTGTGIPESARPHIFEPFFTTKEVGRGTGQGLAIAHSVIVDKHGGTLHFETEVGKGTTFIVRLPLAAPANGKAAFPGNRSHGARSGGGAHRPDWGGILPLTQGNP